MLQWFIITTPGCSLTKISSGQTSFHPRLFNNHFTFSGPVSKPLSYSKPLTSSTKPQPEPACNGPSTSIMSDDEADPELLELLRAHVLGQSRANADPETGVLEGAEYVYDNSIDVALDMWSCKTAANAIYKQMQEKSYSAATWSEHELHPKAKDEATVDFIFTMDLLNFSFWSELPDDKRFAISYKDRTWTGYWSLVAALQRALDEGWFGRLVTALSDRGG